MGRVAISLHALPAILPVAYAVLGDDLVFVARNGSTGLAELHRNVVAFEVDDIDEATGAGWSVVAVGVTRPFDGRDQDGPAASGLQLHPWGLAEGVRLFRLPTQRISGRRFGGHFAAPEPPIGAVLGGGPRTG